MLGSPKGQDFDDRLLHILEIGRDCVDIELVRWAVRASPDTDLHSLLQSRKDLCGGSNQKTGLVRPLGNPAVGPHSPRSAYPELMALNGLISAMLDIYVHNGNKHVSYWQLHDQIDWDGDKFVCLKDHFTLPRLLACFSLFDHNFAGQTCALSKRNYAVWGAERVMKNKLHIWQNGLYPEPLAQMEFEEPSAKGPPKEGTFLSLVEVMRQLRWTADFAPHVGDMLEWVWQTPGLELGIRACAAESASKDARWEDKDRSEKGALHALAERLVTRPNCSEHIAALRGSVHWRDFGLGPLEKFVRKYTAWFELRGDHITLCRRKAATNQPVRDDVEAAKATEAQDSEVEENDDSDSGNETNSEPKDVHKLPVNRLPRPFAMVEGLPYHEICQQQARNAPTDGLPADVALPTLNNDLSLFQKLGEDLQNYVQRCGLRPQDTEHRCWVRSQIQQALKDSAFRQKFPNFAITMFGTSASGLARRDSDLDLLLDVDGEGNCLLQRGDVGFVLQLAQEVLARAGAEELQSIPLARIPLLRGLMHGARFDLSLGTRCGLWNTAFLQQCVQREARMVGLCSCVSAWSKAQGVNDSPNGLLSTYSLLLLVVLFLQLRGLLSVPDEVYEAPTEPSELPLEPPEPGSLGRLVAEFFAFAASFRWDSWVASVRLGAVLPRSAKSRAWRVAPLCVEDPFETHLNTCRRVNPRARRYILGAFQAALRKILQGEGLQGLLGRAAVEVSPCNIYAADELKAALAQRIAFSSKKRLSLSEVSCA
ncbi:unnamed protein product [Effrenium voratum]|nr:unnamed protein product [Effrenium voratum]